VGSSRPAVPHLWAALLAACLAPAGALGMIRIGGIGVGAGEVEVSGTFAYVADTNFGLRVIDVSDPGAPVEVGGLAAPGAYELEVEGQLAFLGAREAWDDGRIVVIDIADPRHPVERGSFADPDCRGTITVVRDVGYAGGFGLCVLDLSSPSAPRKVGFVELPGSVLDIEVAGDVAYVATGIVTSPALDIIGSVQAVDVSRRRVPAVLSSLILRSTAFDAALAGNTLWLALGDALVSVDATDPSALRELATLPLTGWKHRLDVQGSVGLLTNTFSGIQALDLSDPMRPAPLGALDTPGWADGVARVGHLAFVADRSALQVIDVSNPNAPFARSHHETPLPALGLALSDGRAYLTGGDWPSPGFLEVLDVSEPNAPSLLGTLALPDPAFGVALIGDTALLAGYELRTVDVSDPAEPAALGSFPAHSRTVETSGSLAFAGGWLIDVSDPSSPAGAGSLSFSGTGYDVAGDLAFAAGWLLGTSAPGAHYASCVDVAGGTAFLGETVSGGAPGHGAGWLRVVDVSDPTAPLDVVTVKTHGAVHDVAVVGERAYVATAGDSGNVVVLDVSDPAAPTELGAFVTPGSQEQVEIAGGLVHLADGHAGLRIIDFGPEYQGARASPPLLVGLEIAAGARDRIKRGRRNVSASILGSSRVSAADIDVASLALGASAARARGRVRLRDVDGDGREDLLVTFDVAGAPLTNGPGPLCVHGALADGRPILGCDEVQVVAP
jgi:hypothetical protein